jgi:hypothetical protein
MKLTEQTKRHVISAYVAPARQNGMQTIEVRVGSVEKELGWINRATSVFSTLSSKEFQREAGVELIEKRGGPPSGGPSTTVQFVYRVLDPSAAVGNATAAGSPSIGLLDLYGIGAETFRQLGGGEEYLRRERAWGPDVWELYSAEERERKKSEAAE